MLNPDPKGEVPIEEINFDDISDAEIEAAEEQVVNELIAEAQAQASSPQSSVVKAVSGGVILQHNARLLPAATRLHHKTQPFDPANPDPIPGGYLLDIKVSDNEIVYDAEYVSDPKASKKAPKARSPAVDYSKIPNWNDYLPKQ
jgi:hypothetical protein